MVLCIIPFLKNSCQYDVYLLLLVAFGLMHCSLYFITREENCGQNLPREFDGLLSAVSSHQHLCNGSVAQFRCMIWHHGYSGKLIPVTIFCHIQIPQENQGTTRWTCDAWCFFISWCCHPLDDLKGLGHIEVYIGLFSSQWSLFQVLSSVVQVSSTDPPLNCDSFALFGTEAAKPCGGCLLASQLYLTAQLQQLVPPISWEPVVLWLMKMQWLVPHRSKTAAFEEHFYELSYPHGWQEHSVGNLYSLPSEMHFLWQWIHELHK